MVGVAKSVHRCSGVSLGQGITLRAPGLRGTAEAHNVGPGSDTRAPDVDGSGPALDEAIAKVMADYGSANRNKYRPVVYYMLTKHFGKEAAYA